MKNFSDFIIFLYIFFQQQGIGNNIISRNNTMRNHESFFRFSISFFSSIRNEKYHNFS